MLTRPATSAAAPAGGVEETTGGQVNLPQGTGWEDWQVVRDQRAHRATVKVFVRKGEAPATAKVRVMLAQTPKPTFDSPQAILDALVQTAKHQCEKVSANSLRKSAEDLTYELRGFGCAGQKGERYLLQRIAFIGQWELQATYAPMGPTDNLPPSEKQQALKLLSSVTIAQSRKLIVLIRLLPPVFRGSKRRSRPGDTPFSLAGQLKAPRVISGETAAVRDARVDYRACRQPLIQLLLVG